MRKLLTISELSTLLNIARKTVYNLVYRREIPFVKVGGSLRFDPDQIDKWIKISSWLEPIESDGDAK